MLVMCEESESRIEEKIDVGFDDWEGCDRFGLLNLLSFLVKKVSLTNNQKARNFKLHLGAHLDVIYDMICLYLSIGF
jgi:hypothetical protein